MKYLIKRWECSMKIAVNLLNYYSTPKGGDESLAKNLINGFKKYKDNNIEFVYLITKHAYQKFEKYLKNQEVEIFDVAHDRISLRLIWQLFNLNKIIPENTDIFFTPQMKLPINIKNVKTISVFYDTQHKDLPENFSFMERRYFDYINHTSLKNSDLIIPISQFSKNKIESFYNYNVDKEVIYPPIVVNKNISLREETKILDKYNLKKNSYYYTISANFKHKNLKTLIDLFSKKMNKKYVITGPLRDNREIFKNSNDKTTTVTGYITEIEKNVLLKNCRVFLFPSIYEGFGMPIVEALIFGKKIVTTKMGSIVEVSNNKAEYVNDPFDISEWKRKIMKVEKEGLSLSKHSQNYFENKFSLKKIINQYFEVFNLLHKS